MFSINSDWLKVPRSISLGQMVGLAIDDSAHLYVLHRADRIWKPELKETITTKTIIKFSTETVRYLSYYLSSVKFPCPSLIMK